MKKNYSSEKDRDYRVGDQRTIPEDSSLLVEFLGFFGEPFPLPQHPNWTAIILKSQTHENRAGTIRDCKVDHTTKQILDHAEEWIIDAGVAAELVSTPGCLKSNNSTSW